MLPTDEEISAAVIGAALGGRSASTDVYCGVNERGEEFWASFRPSSCLLACPPTEEVGKAALTDGLSD